MVKSTEALILVMSDFRSIFQIVAFIIPIIPSSHEGIPEEFKYIKNAS